MNEQSVHDSAALFHFLSNQANKQVFVAALIALALAYINFHIAEKEDEIKTFAHRKRQHDRVLFLRQVRAVLNMFIAVSATFALLPIFRGEVNPPFPFLEHTTAVAFTTLALTMLCIGWCGYWIHYAQMVGIDTAEQSVGEDYHDGD